METESESENHFALADSSIGFTPVNTVDVRSSGRRAEFVGDSIVERSLRDEFVIAAKFGFDTESGNSRGGSNRLYNIYRAANLKSSKSVGLTLKT